MNWNSIIAECGIDNVTRFAYGRMSKKEFSRLGKACRRLVNQARDPRESAQRAIRHRTTSAQRSRILIRSAKNSTSRV